MADPLWYKDAVIYEVHVRAFYDSDGNGAGDFRGLTQKLDYLQDLGVTAIWVLPFYPSPLRDDGYDIADYLNVHADYGTLRDVRTFIREAHRRGLRVITELVCNHTSDQHAWFQRARRAKPGSTWRDFYVWSDSPDRYAEARIIFKDFESSNWTWDPIARAYYWHRFYSHQPDLNFANPRVRQEVFRALDFWLEMGVDGLRLDAIPYLYEREGTNCENLPETHAFLKELRRHVDERFPDRMLLAEANQWSEDAVAYLGDGDECHMAFHFPIMPRLYMAVRMEDRFPLVDILTQTPAIPESAQWALFLRNHDELTLEMVTDEERDYMYRVYAQDAEMRINVGIRRRLAPLLGNDRRRIELLNALLFSLPGTPVIYYGDEIGMGDNVFLGDRNGVGTPMQWSDDRNAGFSAANRQRLYLPVVVDPEYHYEAVSVATQQRNPHSLLWWMKRLIALRKQYAAFGRGSLEILQPDNRHVLAFIRRHGDEQILVVANLSRFVQPVQVDLSDRQGLVPVELFGRVEFPPIGAQPYFLTLGPHAFAWFSLEPQRAPAELVGPVPASTDLPVIRLDHGLRVPVGAAAGTPLDRLLPNYLQHRRWYRAKARRIRATRLVDLVPVPNGGGDGAIAIARVDFTEGDPDLYALPLSISGGDEAQRLLEELPQLAVARLDDPGEPPDGPPILHDALADPVFCAALIDAVGARRRLRGAVGELQGVPTRAFRSLRGDDPTRLTPALSRAEQSNTSVLFGDRLILKLFRRLEPGVNPDIEVGTFLTERGYEHVPAVAGSLVYHQDGKPVSLAILQAFVPNQGDAWAYTEDVLAAYFERAITSPELPEPVEVSTQALLEDAAAELPEPVQGLIGSDYLGFARLLGARTAELHRVLDSGRDDRAFAPEAFGALYQRSLYQSLRNRAAQSYRLLAQRVEMLPPESIGMARQVLDLEPEVQGRFHWLLDRRIDVDRIRCHGDYHLGQVLYTGRDAVIFDFEGEPARPLGERRMKRSAMVDVAGMLRSFTYAVHNALRRPLTGASIRPEDAVALERWGDFWAHWVGAAFLQAYREAAGDAGFIPRSDDDLTALLDVYLLEKALYELGYELNNRPDWAAIPLRGVLDLLDGWPRA